MQGPQAQARPGSGEFCFKRFIAVVLLFTLGVSACDAKRHAPPPPPPASMEPVPAAMVVDLLFDATLSMQGFTQTGVGQTSYYQQIVQELKGAVTSGWKEGRLTLARFGDEIAPLTEITEVTRPDFYSDDRYNKTTHIERVIERADPKHVTVIVTDLFQNNADINLLTESLKQKYFRSERAVGLLGIRSQFAGTVYDVGIDGRKFGYKSTAEVQTFRPFYVLVLGSHTNVQQYLAKLLENERVAAFPVKQALIFSKFVTSQPSSFRAARLLSADSISESDLSMVLPASYAGQHVKAFRIRRENVTARFSAQWEYAQLKWTQPHSKQLKAEVLAWTTNAGTASELSMIESSHALSAIVVEPTLTQAPGAGGGKLDVAVSLSTDKLPSKGIYLYRMVIRPAEFQLPPWVSEWTLSEQSIAGLASNAPGFDGARTYNLAAFLGGLGRAVLSVSPPEVADIYCYIDVG